MTAHHHSKWLAVLLAGAALGSKAQAQDGAWDVVLNGRSVHINAAHQWNEENWGIGVEREFNGDGRWVKVALANGFKDSADHPSYMAGGGMKRRFRMLGISINRIGTGKTVFVLISFGGATNSPQRSFPGVGYLVQDVLHARGLR